MRRYGLHRLAIEIVILLQAPHPTDTTGCEPDMGLGNDLGQ
jgi:hypothetical protein